jgi:hypothetical protein
MIVDSKSPDTRENASRPARCLSILSSVLLNSDGCANPNHSVEDVCSYSRDDLGQLWALANSHHVIMRTFPALQQVMTAEGNSRSEWFENVVRTEQTRIEDAVRLLAPICKELENVGEVVVIKSLDHWPDLGNDLDLYTTADADAVVSVMRERFHAHVDERSWGDRLANKWNFIVPGLHELVEVHVNRLGQTGEQVTITNGLVAHATRTQFGSFTFRVPAPEARIILSTMQRMYRHFYVRLCDIANIAGLIDSGAIDFPYLESIARRSGLWDGLATYLVILADYVAQYRQSSLELPLSVTQSARLCSDKVHFKKKFLRVPIFPEAANFYAKEWVKLLFNGEVQNTLRLSLLPGLAAAAALASKITGSDKGIW